MKADKVLIIDDRPAGVSYNAEEEINRLNENCRSLIVLCKDRSTENLWVEEEEDVRLIQDFSAYSFIFIHDSHKDPIMEIGQKLILIQKLSATSTVVLFSGGRDEYDTVKLKSSSIVAEASWYELKREQFFNNLGRFMDSFGIFGEYRISYLYERYSSPKTDMKIMLQARIRSHLENSLSEAIHSEEFGKLLKLCNYSDVESIKKRFSSGSDESFSAALDQLL